MLNDEWVSQGNELLDPLRLPTAIKALSLLTIDSRNLRGLLLNGRSGPIREKFFESLHKLFSEFKFQKIHPQVLDTELFGGLDFTKTFESGKPVKTSGYLNKNKSLVLLSMAERLETCLIGKYCSAIDTNQELCFVVSNEGTSEEYVSQALIERIAFSISIEGLHYTDTRKIMFNLDQIELAKKNLTSIPIEENVIKSITEISHKLGINSLRGPILAIYAARASAAFANRTTIQEEDILESVKLVLSHKASVLPSDELAKPEDNQQEPPPQDEKAPNEDQKDQDATIPLDILLEAIRSSLSPEALKNLIDRSKNLKKASSNSGSGQKKLSNRRGRPLPSRAGKLDNTKRLDVIETLKAAAPWQTIRRKSQKAGHSRIIIRGDDIRIKRHQEQSDRLIIFTVDASGTSALGRLGETKGAIEILLAEAYARRDQVALISFRGQNADIELPPTRSLVQTKKRLAGLPAGGGTPLAAGLSTSYNLAQQARNRGMTPSLALLTDGKGNIALDGTPSRTASTADTESFAKLIHKAGIPCILIDTSNRPQIQAKILATNLNATYLALPRADAKRLSKAVTEAMSGP